jgi:hypothetical protein
VRFEIQNFLILVPKKYVQKKDVLTIIGGGLQSQWLGVCGPIGRRSASGLALGCSPWFGWRKVAALRGGFRGMGLGLTFCSVTFFFDPRHLFFRRCGLAVGARAWALFGLGERALGVRTG